MHQDRHERRVPEREDRVPIPPPVYARSVRSPQQLRDLFSAFAPRVVSGPISHFGRLRQSADTFCEIAPASSAELADAVGTAHRHGVPVRIRGQGHALNGASLPAAHELLLRTERLGDVRFEVEGTDARPLPAGHRGSPALPGRRQRQPRAHRRLAGAPRPRSGRGRARRAPPVVHAVHPGQEPREGAGAARRPRGGARGPALVPPALRVPDPPAAPGAGAGLPAR
ncbi:FAD-binding protein [Sorangium sp. So ce834]|uniref:FAD-binding protein n=1 Tax=Sorangium sp. So ce834 TaxID=3133321 RepID=UPI003F5E98B0